MILMRVPVFEGPEGAAAFNISSFIYFTREKPFSFHVAPPSGMNNRRSGRIRAYSQ